MHYALKGMIFTLALGYIAIDSMIHIDNYLRERRMRNELEKRSEEESVHSPLWRFEFKPSTTPKSPYDDPIKKFEEEIMKKLKEKSDKEWFYDSV